MALDQPFPDLDELLGTIGAAGQRLGAIDASEGAAGNISMVIGWPLEVRRRFPLSEPFELPLPVPALAGHLVIVTGSGRRLRDIHLDPAANLAAVLIDADGQTGGFCLTPQHGKIRLRHHQGCCAYPLNTVHVGTHGVPCGGDRHICWVEPRSIPRKTRGWRT